MEVKVDAGEKLRKAIREAATKVGDLTIPLTEISRQWFKSNRAIFTLQSAGKYVDLSAPYKKAKKRDVGFVYPILKRSGALERSITNPSDNNAVSYIINKLALAVGTSVTNEKGVPYPAIIHEGRGSQPERLVVLFGNEQIAPPQLNKRIEGWRRTLLDYAAQVSGAK